MSFWNIFGIFAVSDKGETIQKVSGNTSISSDGTVYTKTGNTTIGSDGSVFTDMGAFSSDGSTRMGSAATGLGAVFNDQPGVVAGIGSRRAGEDDDFGMSRHGGNSWDTGSDKW